MSSIISDMPTIIMGIYADAFNGPLTPIASSDEEEKAQDSDIPKAQDSNIPKAPNSDLEEGEISEPDKGPVRFPRFQCSAYTTHFKQSKSTLGRKRRWGLRRVGIQDRKKLIKAENDKYLKNVMVFMIMIFNVA